MSVVEKIKVLIVDNGVLDRKILTDAVTASGQAAVVQTASTAEHALAQLRQKSYDLVLLSISLHEHPVLKTLGIVRQEFPKSVVWMTGTKAEFVLQGVPAMAMGASGLLYKNPVSAQETELKSMTRQFEVLFDRYAARRRWGEAAAGRMAANAGVLLPNGGETGWTGKRKPPQGVDLVLIAASTGGPVALEKVCISLPSSLQPPVLIVQHMPKDFTRIMADALDAQAPLRIYEGVDGAKIENGEIVIAPGGLHMTASSIGGNHKICLASSPPVNGVRPAADVLFSSVAQAYRGARILVAVLTGMGNDGTQGVRLLKLNCDCYCLIQSEKSCAVYGMPRSIYEAGLADEVLDIEEIAGRITQLVAGRS